MAHHPTSPALPAGFRRRFPLELSPAEYEALEAAGKAHGSKRAALLAGLAAPTERDARGEESARGAASATKARGQITALTRRVAELEQQLDQANTTLAASAARAHTASQEAEATSLRALKDTQWADEARAAEHERRRELEAELAALEESHVDELRCPRCGKFAPSDQWATKRTTDGHVVFHEPCGYHEGGFLDDTSVLGRRRPL